MSGSEEKKLNSLHEVDSLYKVQGGKAAYQISPAYGQNTLYKVNPVHDAWERALAAESICQAHRCGQRLPHRHEGCDG